MTSDAQRVPDAVAPPPGHLRLPLVDGVRALAATTILALHVGGNVGVGASWWGELVSSLSIGVPVFFVISGFLLYRPFVAADILGASAIKGGSFLWRRALRIVPLYWVVLTIVGLITAQSTARPGGFFSGEPWWLFYAFGQVYNPGAAGGGLTQAWTLCIEVTFYLLLPVYAIAVSRLRRRGLALEMGVLAALAAMSLSFRMLVIGHAAVYTLPSFFYLFSVGMAMAIVSVQAQRAPRLLPRLAKGAKFAWVAAAVLYCVRSWLLLPHHWPLAIDLADATIAALLLSPAVFDDRMRSVARRFLANPFVAWVGLISYGLYLWHPQVVSAIYNSGLGGHFHGVGYFPLTLIAFAATAAVAGVTYYTVERPVLKLKRIRPQLPWARRHRTYVSPSAQKSRDGFRHIRPKRGT